MTFRARLQQAIIGVVAVVTAAVLWVAQRQNSATFDGMVETLFQQQSAGFQRMQEIETAAAHFQAGLGDSVRVFAALEEGDPETYLVAADEVRLGDFTFFRLASTEAGGLLEPPPESRAGLLEPATNAALRQQLEPVAAAFDTDSTATHLGFLTLPETGNENAVCRVLALPVRKFDTTAGVLFIGQSIDVSVEPAAGSPAPVADENHAALLPFLVVQDEVHGALPPDAKPAIRDCARAATPPSALRLDGLDYRVRRHVVNAGSAFPPATLVSLFPLAGFQKQRRELQGRIIVIGLVGLGLSVFAGHQLAKQLSRPVRELVAATHEVRAGNLEVRLPPGRTREFATLTQSFNEMTEGLALKERYHNVLSMVTDAQVAEQLVAGKIRLGGEARQVSVLFCDIRGYTALSAGMDPEKVIAILNVHMGALTGVVYRHHGVITQFAGDAIMAVFGAPASHGNDAENAARCALDMLAERERLNREAPPPLGIGIGIASGAVVAGCIGAEKRADYTVIGERVNLAARLCSAAGAGRIFIDATTRAALPPAIAAGALPEPLQLKGFAGGVPAWEVGGDGLEFVN